MVYIWSEHIYVSLVVNSESEFAFSSAYSSGAHCDERIFYQCPALFAIFCEREVKFQRDAIMENLKKHYVWVYYIKQNKFILNKKIKKIDHESSVNSNEKPSVKNKCILFL